MAYISKDVYAHSILSDSILKRWLVFLLMFLLYAHITYPFF